MCQQRPICFLRPGACGFCGPCFFPIQGILQVAAGCSGCVRCLPRKCWTRRSQYDGGCGGSFSRSSAACLFGLRGTVPEWRSWRFASSPMRTFSQPALQISREGFEMEVVFLRRPLAPLPAHAWQQRPISVAGTDAGRARPRHGSNTWRARVLQGCCISLECWRTASPAYAFAAAFAQGSEGARPKKSVPIRPLCPRRSRDGGRQQSQQQACVQRSSFIIIFCSLELNTSGCRSPSRPRDEDSAPLNKNTQPTRLCSNQGSPTLPRVVRLLAKAFST